MLILVFLGFSSFYLLLYNQDIIVATNSVIHLQEQLELVMENLDEAIIQKTDEGISFCNNLGTAILQNTFDILKCDRRHEKFPRQSRIDPKDDLPLNFNLIKKTKR